MRIARLAAGGGVNEVDVPGDKLPERMLTARRNVFVKELGVVHRLARPASYIWRPGENRHFRLLVRGQKRSAGIETCVASTRNRGRGAQRRRFAASRAGSTRGFAFRSTSGLPGRPSRRS